jgi:hypothetical protein
MKRICSVAAVALILLLPVTVAFAAGGREKHPRLHRAVMALEGAIADLKAAPHDFGGHRAAAVDACEKAVAQLKQVLSHSETGGGGCPPGSCWSAGHCKPCATP